MIELAAHKARQLPFVKGRKRLYCLVLDKRGKILAQAANDYDKSSPIMLALAKKVGEDNKCYWHSECLALHRVRSGIPYKLVVARVDSEGNMCNAKPCKICERQIKEKGVKVVEYSV